MQITCKRCPTDILYVLPCKKNGTVKLSIIDTTQPDEIYDTVELDIYDCVSIIHSDAIHVVDGVEIRLQMWSVECAIDIGSECVVMDNPTHDKLCAELKRLTCKD